MMRGKLKRSWLKSTLLNCNNNLFTEFPFTGEFILTVKKAIIPAAGLGTRFLPATKSMPKEMLPIIDTPVIQYVVQECVESGIEDILIISGKGKRSIEDHFDRNFELEARIQEKEDEVIFNQLRHIEQMANIHFIRQKELNGLGDAIFHAR